MAKLDKISFTSNTNIYNDSSMVASNNTDKNAITNTNAPLKCLRCSCSFNKNWQRTVKRKYDQFENVANGGVINMGLGIEYTSVARVEIENECVALRETLGSQQQSIQELYTELEEERNASSSAANEAMSMILRLQREKAEIQMESRQFKRFAEEKMAHDQQELLTLEDLLYKREQTIQSLMFEVQAYKHRMLSYGCTEAEVEEGEKEGGGGRGQRRTPSFYIDNFDAQLEFPSFDYPLLRCDVNDNQGGDVEIDYDVPDVEKYPFGENPLNGETPMQNLESRIYDLERTPRGTKNILEKVIVGQSPKNRPTKHARKFSIESSSSLYGGHVKETNLDTDVENRRPGTSFKKTEYFTRPSEDYLNPEKVDTPSEVGDDMSDRIYTIDSVHNGPKVHIGLSDEYVATPRNMADVGDPDVKKLYLRLQALEADRESMKQELISMRTDKAQLILLKEIAQHLSKDLKPERRLPVKKPTRSFWAPILKWIMDIICWRRHQSKYMFDVSERNVGLLLLLEDGCDIRSQWKRLANAQV